MQEREENETGARDGGDGSRTVVPLSAVGRKLSPAPSFHTSQNIVE